MCDWVKLLGPMFMSNSRPVKCADILTISGLNLCQEAVKSGKKNNFSRSAVYHISGDREAWLRPFYRTFTNRFVEKKKTTKSEQLQSLSPSQGTTGIWPSCSDFKLCLFWGKFFQRSLPRTITLALPPPAPLQPFQTFFFPIHLQSNGKSLNCGGSPL